MSVQSDTIARIVKPFTSDLKTLIGDYGSRKNFARPTMRALRFMTIAGISSMLMSAACLAAAMPNFSGRWVLDAASSTLKFKSVSSQTLDIKQTGSTLEVTDTTGDVKTKHTYTLDGTKRKINVEGVKTVELSANWQGSALHIESDSGRMKLSETWQLVDGGKTLSIDRSTSGLVSRQEQIKYRKE